MSMHEADGRRDEEQPYGPPPAGPAYRQEMPIIGPDGLQDRVPHRGPQPGPHRAPQPSARHYVTVLPTKSVPLAAVLAFFFGPLGMLYATVLGALIMFLVNIAVAIITLGFGLLLTWPICVLWAAIAASNHNQRLSAAVLRGGR